MRVISLRTDQCLNEGQSYDATFKDEFGESGEVYVYYVNEFEDNPVIRKCVRMLHEDVVTTWAPRLNHGPWDMDA
jgi:hypothetical protein